MAIYKHKPAQDFGLPRSHSSLAMTKREMSAPRRALGADSIFAKNRQSPVSKQDLLQWTNYTDNADISFKSKDDMGQDMLISAKQINGHFAKWTECADSSDIKTFGKDD